MEERQLAKRKVAAHFTASMVTEAFEQGIKQTFHRN